MNRPQSDPIALLRIALAATRCLEREPLFGALAAGAVELFGALYVLAYHVSASGEDLDCLAVAGEGDPRPVRRALGILDAGLVRTLTGDRPALLPEAEVLLPTGEDEGLPALGAGLLIPLASSAGTLGTLLVVASASHTLDAGDVALAADLARELQPALDNLRAVESLRELVIRDDTADCYNRRYLDQDLEDELERARRFGGSLGLIFLDMDNLKEINTTHGHSSGSRVLYEASVRIGRSIRSIDKLFRYGGDEFVTLLPGTGLEGAREVAERMRREIGERPFELATGAKVQLTVSCGVAAWPEHGPTGRGLVEAGDAVMRQVKARGKNSVAVAPVASANDPGRSRPGSPLGSREGDDVG